MEYRFSDIESRWKKFWEENKVYKVSNTSDKPKYYVTESINEENAAGEKIWGGKKVNKKRKNTNLKQKRINKNKTKRRC